MDPQHLLGDELADPLEDLFCALQKRSDLASVIAMAARSDVVPLPTHTSTRHKYFGLRGVLLTF